MSKIFKQHGLSPTLLHRIIHANDAGAELARVKPGETLELIQRDDGTLRGLIYRKSPAHSIEIEIDEDGSPHVKSVDRPLEHRTLATAGTIEDSLFEAAQRAGLSDKITLQLAKIFGWDIDFALEIRSGDRFRVIYSADFLDGKKVRDGEILAAEFINRGRVFRAFRYTTADGDSDYYDEQGHNMRKAFLRTPVKFTRISSRFTRRRWHPVLKRWRSHKGVDYAAPKGTPVKAAGKGKVIYRGWKGGYGRVIMIQHSRKYTTVYGHLSAFNKKVRNGSRVKQGQVIGYVGMSGLATGPHLHYELRVNGVHTDPLKVKLPKTLSLPKRYRADFQAKIRPLMARLEHLGETQVAHADD